MTVGPDHTSLDLLAQLNSSVVTLAVHRCSQPILRAVDFFDDIFKVRPTSVRGDGAELLVCDQAAVRRRVENDCRIEEVALVRALMEQAIHFPPIADLQIPHGIAVPAIQNNVVALRLAFLFEALETAEQVNILDGADVGVWVGARPDDRLSGRVYEAFQKAFVDVGVHVDPFGGDASLAGNEPRRQCDLLGHLFNVFHVRADDHWVITGAIN